MAKFNKKGGALKVVLITIGVIIVLGFLVLNFLLPKILNNVANTAVNVAVNQIKNIDYTNAQVLPLNQSFTTSNASLILSLNKGNLTIDNQSKGNVISGESKYLGQKPSVEYTAQEGVGILNIKSLDQEGEDRTIHLSPTLPTSISAGIGAGIVNADLTGLKVPKIDIGAGAGEVNVKLSNTSSVTASFAAGAGSLHILVPKNVGHKVIFSQNMFSNLQLGPEYVKTETGFETKNYASSALKADISIGQALGGFNINIVE